MDTPVEMHRCVINMKTTKKRTLIASVLIVVIAFAGNASADPAGGQINSDVVAGQIVTLYLDVNPSDYVTTVVRDGSTMDPPLDYYYFSSLAPLLDRNGFSLSTTDPFNATIEMRCSGTERDIDGNIGSAYTNTLRNTTPTTAHIQGVYDGALDWVIPLMELESCASEETFSKTLYAGWNLISLPLTPSDSSVSAVLSGVSCDAVYRYNATSKQFESADVLDPGTGYFVHVASECTWTYSGTAYNSTGISLKQGLNMVGWLNCLKDVDDALSSISGDYYYAARWNTSAEMFEVYNPAAPSAFNDFTAMDRGAGYFISAKHDCTLSENC